MTTKILDLFAGQGGFSLAGHWRGWETAAFVEWDSYCQKVLNKNFPGVPIFGDINQFDGKEYKGAVDVICGGFPCQPFSSAGKQLGKADDRYLWPEMLRVIREVKPAWVVGENVPRLISLDDGDIFEEICTSLESEGYKVQTFIIPALALGAPHRRNRVWIIAYNPSFRRDKGEGRPKRPHEINRQDAGRCFTNNSGKDDRRHKPGAAERQKQQFGIDAFPGADPDNSSKQDGGIFPLGLLANLAGSDSGNHADDHPQGFQGNVWGEFQSIPEADEALEREKFSRVYATGQQWGEHWFEAATRLCRMDDGLPAWMVRHRTNRLKGMGNAVSPQIPYQLFGMIDQLMKEHT